MKLAPFGRWNGVIRGVPSSGIRRSRTVRPWPTRVAAVLALAAITVLGPTASALASSAYEEDPIGLVPFRESVYGVHSSGEDRWEVWVCDVPGWDVAVEPEALVADLESIITPYFRWLSDGRYSPVFSVGGVVVSDDEIPAPVSGLPILDGCEAEAGRRSTSAADGLLIVADGGYGAGYGSAGYVCPPPFGGCPSAAPASARRVVVGAGSVAAVDPFPQPRWKVIAHEIGHALSWAHSFGGALTLSGSVNEYDNVVDVMSGLALRGLPVGTHAYNRYAAGWIDPEAVVVHAGESATYTFGSDGSGIRMVVVPQEEGLDYVLGVRRAVGWDQDLAAVGVEVYLVDSRPGACTPWPSWPDGYPCFGSSTRIAPDPAPRSIEDTSHVKGPGSSFRLGRWQVSVSEDTGGLSVRIGDGSRRGRFADDDNSPHEADIESIAEAGLTTGCDRSAPDRFCPDRTVTRAAMAAFLVRALGIDVDDSPAGGAFTDVPADAWYAPHAAALAARGITTGYGDGTFRPDAPVSRAQMAAFLARAFELTSGGEPARFGDVEDGAWYAEDVAAMFSSGISRGCSERPRSYCPNSPVTRGQMASFLARALHLGDETEQR